MNIFTKSVNTLTVDGRQMATGDEIGVFDSIGLCCGAWAYNTASLSITVYGQQPDTSQIDGFSNNELMHFKMWDGVLNKELPAKATFVLVDPTIPANLLADSLYEQDHLSELASLTSGPNAVLPRAGNANAYLFFTNGALNYSLLHPEPVNLTFFDLLGRSALSINRSETAGAHRIGLQSLNLPDGLYTVRFKAGAVSLQQSLIVTGHRN